MCNSNKRACRKRILVWLLILSLGGTSFALGASPRDSSFDPATLEPAPFSLRNMGAEGTGLEELKQRLQPVSAGVEESEERLPGLRRSLERNRWLAIYHFWPERNEKVIVKVNGIPHPRVKLAFFHPPEILVYRQEIWEQMLGEIQRNLGGTDTLEAKDFLRGKIPKDKDTWREPLILTRRPIGTAGERRKKGSLDNVILFDTERFREIATVSVRHLQSNRVELRIPAPEEVRILDQEPYTRAFGDPFASGLEEGEVVKQLRRLAEEATGFPRQPKRSGKWGELSRHLRRVDRYVSKLPPEVLRNPQVAAQLRRLDLNRMGLHLHRSLPPRWEPGRKIGQKTAKDLYEVLKIGARYFPTDPQEANRQARLPLRFRRGVRWAQAQAIATLSASGEFSSSSEQALDTVKQILTDSLIPRRFTLLHLSRLYLEQSKRYLLEEEEDLSNESYLKGLASALMAYFAPSDPLVPNDEEISLNALLAYYPHSKMARLRRQYPTQKLRAILEGIVRERLASQGEYASLLDEVLYPSATALWDASTQAAYVLADLAVRIRDFKTAAEFRRLAETCELRLRSRRSYPSYPKGRLFFKRSEHLSAGRMLKGPLPISELPTWVADHLEDFLAEPGIQLRYLRVVYRSPDGDTRAYYFPNTEHWPQRLQAELYLLGSPAWIVLSRGIPWDAGVLHDSLEVTVTTVPQASSLSTTELRPLEEVLQDLAEKDWRARWDLLSHLAVRKDAWERPNEVLPRVLETARRRSKPVRLMAAILLGLLAYRYADDQTILQAIDFLSQRLTKDRDWEVRFYAAWAMGNQRVLVDKTALLRVSMHDTDERVRQQADRILDRIVKEGSLSWETPEDAQPILVEEATAPMSYPAFILAKRSLARPILLPNEPRWHFVPLGPGDTVFVDKEQLSRGPIRLVVKLKETPAETEETYEAQRYWALAWVERTPYSLPSAVVPGPILQDVGEGASGTVRLFTKQGGSLSFDGIQVKLSEPDRDFVSVKVVGSETVWMEARASPRLRTGLEEKEKITAEQFVERYGRQLKQEPQRQALVVGWLKTPHVRITDLVIPSLGTLYTQGYGMLSAVQSDLLPRIPPGFYLTAISLPVTQWEKTALILLDKGLDQPVANPLGLPTETRWPSEIKDLDPMQVILRIFRSRLEVPESEDLGALLLTDSEGSVHLVLFSA